MNCSKVFKIKSGDAIVFNDGTTYRVGTVVFIEDPWTDGFDSDGDIEIYTSRYTYLYPNNDMNDDIILGYYLKQEKI